MLKDPEKMHFHYMTYGHALAQEPLPRGFMKVTILVDPSLVIITMYIVCLIYAWVFIEIMLFHYMTYMATP